MKKKVSKSKLFVLKNKCLQLRAFGQLPFYLTKLIYRLDGTEDLKYVQFLMFLTENYMRTRSFYKKYKDFDKQCILDIKALLKDKGFDNYIQD